MNIHNGLKTVYSIDRYSFLYSHLENKKQNDYDNNEGTHLENAHNTHTHTQTYRKEKHKTITHTNTHTYSNSVFHIL